MRILILTWCYNTKIVNYGEVLQCFALQRACEKMGHVVRVLMYRRLYEHERNIDIPEKNSELRKEYEKNQRYYFVESNGKEKLDRVTGFIEKYINQTDIYYDKSEIDEEITNTDLIIIGSDQLWNPIWLDDIYLANFDNKGKKIISYATSGLNGIKQDYADRIDEMTKMISKFDHISVREFVSQRVLIEYFGGEVDVVLDPTMLLTEEDYNGIIGIDYHYNSKYIFAFYIGPIEPHKHLLRHIKKKYHADYIVVINMYDHKNKAKDINDLFWIDDAGPCDFISLIKNAEVICTDSYHAMLFSIIYHKEFIIMHRYRLSKELGNLHRFYTVFEKFNITNRFSNSKQEIDGLSRINYDYITKRIEEEICESKKWLEQSILN